MYAPIVARGKIIGGTQLEHYVNDRVFSKCDLEMLSNLAADPLAVALDNASLVGALYTKEPELHELLAHIIAAQERERAARDLHDIVSQTASELLGMFESRENTTGGVSKTRGPTFGLQMDDLEKRCSEVPVTHGLTPREREIPLLSVRGCDAEQIRRTLVLSLGTVRSHTHSIHEKPNVHSRRELMDLVEGLKTTSGAFLRNGVSPRQVRELSWLSKSQPRDAVREHTRRPFPLEATGCQPRARPR